MKSMKLWTSLGLLLLMAGCATVPERVDEPEEERELLEAGIWDVRRGELLDFEQFLDRLEEADFVLVGESHGEEWHHQAQAEIYRGLTRRQGQSGQVMLGLEMVESRFQDVLDGYIDGDLDENQMLTGVQWDDRWGVDERNYAPLWRLAREQGQAVVGLNARRELVRAVGSVGVEGLSEELQEELPDMDLSNDAYRSHLRRIFGAHGMGDDEEGLDRFYQAQVVWDETMAQNAFEALAEVEDSQMVIIAGRGHIERGFGIPSRLIRRGAAPEAVVSVVPVTTQGPRAVAMEKYRDLEFLQEGQIADYVWIQE